MNNGLSPDDALTDIKRNAPYPSIMIDAPVPQPHGLKQTDRRHVQVQAASTSRHTQPYTSTMLSTKISGHCSDLARPDEDWAKNADPAERRRIRNRISQRRHRGQFFPFLIPSPIRTPMSDEATHWIPVDARPVFAPYGHVQQNISAQNGDCEIREIPDSADKAPPTAQFEDASLPPSLNTNWESGPVSSRTHNPLVYESIMADEILHIPYIDEDVLLTWSINERDASERLRSYKILSGARSFNDCVPTLDRASGRDLRALAINDTPEPYRIQALEHLRRQRPRDHVELVGRLSHLQRVVHENNLDPTLDFRSVLC
ncbi:hypothetical protein J7T55_000467 [Diaporthe amygdali]|uniref:uncharacterized protein n=1 Tax=Phomopsis amygdali TaxID=1214568 RepID=UPI0022FF3ED7|nr:uncharacterized protein J7T55_000467 [Diaporthe amygdali]KAJ0100667.1 hypothetical protein J7T55_000467 [Diaporthe amygdali]